MAGASVAFIEWMHQRVPERQLSAEQLALIRWYGKRHRSGAVQGITPDDWTPAHHWGWAYKNARKEM